MNKLLKNVMILKVTNLVAHFSSVSSFRWVPFNLNKSILCAVLLIAIINQAKSFYAIFKLRNYDVLVVFNLNKINVIDNKSTQII